MKNRVSYFCFLMVMLFCYFPQGSYAKADKTVRHEEAKKQYEEIPQQTLQADTTNPKNKQHRALLYMKTGAVDAENGRYRESLFLLNKSLQLYKQLNDNRHVAQIYVEKSMLYLKQGKNRQALKNLLKAKEGIKQIATPDLKQEIPEKEILYFGFITLVWLVTVVVFMWKWRHCKRIRQEKEQGRAEAKYHEQAAKTAKEKLERMKTVLHKKSKQIASLKQEVEELSNPDEKREFNRKMRLLRESRILTEDDWVKYFQVFSQIYPDFENKLRQYHHLSPGDKRHLVFLKLGFSQKEVARLLGISNEGVKRARQRLAKKLKLAGTRELYRFVDTV